MKPLYTIIFTAILLPLTVSGHGNAIPVGGVECTTEVRPGNGQLSLSVTIDPSGLRIRPQEMVLFTPVLISAAGDEYIKFKPVMLAGSKRYRWFGRQAGYGGIPSGSMPDVVRKHRNRSPKPFTLTYNLSLKDWMLGASLAMYTETSGCVGCGVKKDERFLATVPAPEFRVTYIIPDMEPKTRSENYVCRLSYVVNKYDLVADFRDNAKILSEVDKIIRSIISNPDFTVTACRVDGYASPEGPYGRNTMLAEMRAREFVNYLRKNYGWDTRIVSSAGHGEDWKGLRDAVAGMAGFEYRSQVLDIIDGTYDIDRRKNMLKSLAGGGPYKQLLNTVYPPLRRNEFSISYEIRPYSVEEARQIFKTSPAQLSLNELFFVAQSYPGGSPEFKSVFDMAARIYPDSDIAKVNTAAMEIEYGAERMAAERIQDVGLAEAYNNLGVAYAIMGEYALAAEMFEKAAMAGDINAGHNIDQLGILYIE